MYSFKLNIRRLQISVMFVCEDRLDFRVRQQFFSWFFHGGYYNYIHN
jgi:hypothetical protein